MYKCTYILDGYLLEIITSFVCGVGLGKRRKKETIVFTSYLFQMLEFFYHAKYTFPDYILEL